MTRKEFLDFKFPKNIGISELEYLINKRLRACEVFIKESKSIEYYQNEYKITNRNGYLYLFDNGKYIKIGTTQDINERIRTISRMNPNCIITYYKKIHHYTQKEKQLHLKYAEKRIAGEWFLLTKSDIRDIIKDVELYQNDIGWKNNTSVSK